MGVKLEFQVPRRAVPRKVKGKTATSKSTFKKLYCKGIRNELLVGLLNAKRNKSMIGVRGRRFRNTTGGTYRHSVDGGRGGRLGVSKGSWGGVDAKSMQGGICSWHL